MVGAIENPPFVLKRQDGTWSGIGIDLWRSVAAALNVRYEIKEVSRDQADDPAKHNIDIVPAFVIAGESEAKSDISAPYMTTGQAIAVRAEPASGIGAIFDKVLSWTFFKVIGLLIVVTFAVGTIVWRLDRKANPEEYGETPTRGMLGGVLWTIEALMGTSDPLKAQRARAFALLWSLVCVVLISGMTAKLSSELTVNQLNSSIAGPDDLPKVKVGAVRRPSVAASYLDRKGIKFTAYNDVGAALAGLASGEVDAVVSTAPRLAYRVNHQYSEKISVLPGTFNNVAIGLGLKLGTPNRKQINLALLTHIESEAWQQTLVNYLGAP
ncbi:MAG: transporter substrate-binding domain-containing protein [Kofleriaceae bacterium]